MENVIREIKEAELVLIGLGEELDAIRQVRNSEKYKEISEKISDPRILSFIQKVLLEREKEEKLATLQMLAGVLKQKNYFVVSVCLDGFAGKAGFKEERVVEPCGSYERLQCSEKCNTNLYEIQDSLMQQVEAFVRGDAAEEEIQIPNCPCCGKPLVFNNVETENYLEEGYLDQWTIYKKWLQGTVNKKLCILELGVGMKYPTVIRWPFEKVTFFNQKAELFRVHSRLFQITEEIREKGFGICQKPQEFIRELSNAF